MNINSLIGHALYESEKSQERHKHGAIIFRKGTVIAKGFNKTGRRLPRYENLYWPGSIHAEVSAILNAKCSVAGAHCLVVRRNMRLSAPCAKCREVLKAAGIKSVFYSDGLFISRDKLKD